MSCASSQARSASGYNVTPIESGIAADTPRVAHTRTSAMAEERMEALAGENHALQQVGCA